MNLPTEESAVINELEKILGKTLGLHIDTNFHQVGFRVTDGHITRLWLVGQQLSELPSSLGNLQALQVLVLKSNQLANLPAWFDQLGNLEVLDLSCNHLEQLPEVIIHLKKLKQLFLRENNLLALPENVGAMKNLERLYLNNNLLCSLPKSLATLQFLKFLDIRNNYFITTPGKGCPENLNTGHLQGFDSTTGTGVTGEIGYDIIKLPSFRDTIFLTIFRMINSGTSPIEGMTIRHAFQPEFSLLDLEGVTFYLDRPDTTMPIELTRSEVHAEQEIIEFPAKKKLKKPTREASHIFNIKFENFHENPIIGSFKPGDTICFKFMIQANKPNAEVIFSPETACRIASPSSDRPLDVYFQGLDIPVAHVRRKFRKGKEIKALPSSGNYEITLFIENTGEFNLEDVVVTDRVPMTYQATNFSPEEPVTITRDNQDILSWRLQSLKPGQGWSQTYRISGEGEYSASDAQFSI